MVCGRRRRLLAAGQVVANASTPVSCADTLHRRAAACGSMVCASTPCARAVGEPSTVGDAKVRRYLGAVASRSRIRAFGSALALAVAGGMCALVGGLTGEILTIVLVSAGLGGAVLLVFLEIGLSEDQDRAQAEEHKAARGDRARAGQRRLRRHRGPRRPG